MTNNTQNNQKNSNNIPIDNALLFLFLLTALGGVVGTITGTVLVEEYGETEEITKLNSDNVPITIHPHTDESMRSYFLTPLIGGFAGSFALGLLTLMFVMAYQSELAAKVGKAVNTSMDSVKRLFCNSFKALKGEGAGMSLNDNSNTALKY